MAPWRVRDFHADDFDAAVRLWDNPAVSTEADIEFAAAGPRSWPSSASCSKAAMNR
jgi:hypothetical protein